MTKVIERLEDRGLVRRDPHPTDGRQCLISRTEAAGVVHRGVPGAAHRLAGRAFDLLSDEDRRAVLDRGAGLARLADLP